MRTRIHWALRVDLNMLKMINQVRGDPSRWIKKRTQHWFQSTRDCHTQLWRKQNISEFKSLYNGSRIILIEQHFKPTCSRITSTIHSAKIRRRWSANWGNVELFELCENYTKSTMFSVSSLLESRNRLLHLRTMLDLQRIQKKFLTDLDWMHSLSRTTW